MIARLLVALLAMALLAGCATTGRGGTTADQEAARTNTQLGVYYLRQGNLSQSMVKLRKALEQDSSYADAHMAMALVYERMNEPRRAEQRYRRAIFLDSENSEARNNFGRFLCGEGRLDEALEQFRAAAANPVYDRPALALTNAGLCSRRAGEIRKAEEFFLSALETNGRFAPALLNMAELRYANGEHLSARGFYQRYLEVAAGQTPKSLWLGVRIETALGNTNEAASYSLVLKSKYPESPQTRSLLDWEKDGRQ